MSNDDLPTLAQAVARFAPAEDVTDLDTARRLVTCLREQVGRVIDESQPIEGEYSAFLDPEHERMLHLLYDNQALVGSKDDPYWLDPPDLESDAFTDFVQAALDLAWDMAHDEVDAETFPYRGTGGLHHPPAA